MSDPAVLLEARDVTRHFKSRHGTLRAVDGVSLAVREGETLGLVGESGCGKSTLARCLARLDAPTSGRVEFAGTDLTRLSRRALRPVRGDLQFVFQDPYASLNPRRRVGDIVEEPLRIHGSSGSPRARVAELFEAVGLNPGHADRYPHEFSGGQRQRIGIARALAAGPRMIIADEPVSALDVSIQAQVLNLFADLQKDFGLTYLFIAHDLGVVQHVSDRVGVMYLGSLVEIGAAEELYAAPLHPYTEALLSAAPRIEGDPEPPGGWPERVVLTGDVPTPIDRPTGCAFASRCHYAQDRCRTERPPLTAVGAREVACHFPLGTSC